MYYYSPLVNKYLIAAAVAPALFLLIYIYRKDRLEKEPLGLLASLVILGVFSTEGALIWEKIACAILDILPLSNRLYMIIENFFIVAIAEEVCKFALLKFRTWNNRNFNCRFDGVVYAVCVSMGFALWENINYVLMYGFETAIVRAFTAVPGHCCFGVFMGVWYGAAKGYENAGDYNMSKVSRQLSLILPILLHGAYDYIASSPDWGLGAYFYPFILVMFFITFRLLKSQAHKDRYIHFY